MSIFRDVEVRFSQKGAPEVARAAKGVEESVVKTGDAAKKAGGGFTSLGDAARKTSLALDAKGQKLEDVFKGTDRLLSILGKATAVGGALVLAYEGISALVRALSDEEAQLARTQAALDLMTTGVGDYNRTVADAIAKTKEWANARAAAMQGGVGAAAGSLGVGEGALDLQSVLSGRASGAGGFDVATARGNLLAAYETQQRKVNDLVRQREALLAKQAKVTRDEAALMSAPIADIEGRAIAAAKELRQLEVAFNSLRQTSGDPFKSSGGAASAAGGGAVARPESILDIASAPLRPDLAGIVGTPEGPPAIDTRGDAGAVHSLFRAAMDEEDAYVAMLERVAAAQDAAFGDALQGHLDAAAGGFAAAAVNALLYGESVTEGMKMAIAATAQASLVDGFRELALGIGASFWNPAAAATHFASAKAHFAVGGVAAAIGMATGAFAGGGSGGGGGGGAGSPGGAYLPTGREAIPRERGYDGPQTLELNVNFSGQPIHTQREIGEAVRRALQETSSMRGVTPLPTR